MPQQNSFNTSAGTILITGHRGMGVSEKPRYQYHNGAHFYPENCIASFEQAIEQGAQAVECDIHVSRDGVAMVIHGSKLALYADLISSAASDLSKTTTLEQCMLCLPGGIWAKTKTAAVSIDDELRVERFVAKELQELFCLRAHDQEDWTQRIFDSLNSQEKIALSPTTLQQVASCKQQQLKINPKNHQIPTLTQLLQLLYVENKSRYQLSQPPIKLNIELKGAGSAIASIFSILQFYETTPDAAKHISPSDIIFLGRKEIGEIAIANALLKYKQVTIKEEEVPDLGMTELFIHFYEQNTSLVKKYEQQYADQQTMNHSIANILQKYASSPKMCESAFVLAYLKIGGDPDYFFDFIRNDVITGLDHSIPQEQLQNNFRENYATFSAKTKTELNQLITPKKTAALEPEEQKKSKSQNITKELIQKLSALWHIPTTTNEFLHTKMLLEFTQKQKKKTVEEQLENNRKQMLIATKYTAAENPYRDTCHTLYWIHAQLNECRTNLMLSTGDLFGVAAVVDTDFNVKEDIKDLSASGYEKIRTALEWDQYDGIDISLFDYCSGVYRAIECAIHSGKLNAQRLILGATASNWRASKVEYSPIKPSTAPQKAQCVVNATGLPLLLKVDEPGLFGYLVAKMYRAEKKNQIRASLSAVMPDHNSIPYQPEDSSGYSRVNSQDGGYYASRAWSSPENEEGRWSTVSSRSGPPLSHAVMSPTLDISVPASHNISQDSAAAYEDFDRRPNRKPSRGIGNPNGFFTCRQYSHGGTSYSNIGSPRTPGSPFAATLCESSASAATSSRSKAYGAYKH